MTEKEPIHRMKLLDQLVVFICPDHNEKYKKRRVYMEALLSSLGFKHVIHYKSGTERYPECLVTATIDILETYLSRPFLLMEDDVEYTGVSFDVDIDEDVDAVYLGLSEFAGHPTMNTHMRPVKYEAYSDTQVRVLSMLAAHAIFYNSPAYKLGVINALLSKPSPGYHSDVLISRIQPHYKVLALKKPMFFQSNMFNTTAMGDIEAATYIELCVEGGAHTIHRFLPIKRDIVFVTAFKDIGRKTRSNDVYYNYFFNLANNIEYKLVVFLEAKIKEELLQKYTFKSNIYFMEMNCVPTFYDKYLEKEEIIISSEIYKNKIPTMRKNLIEHTSAKYNLVNHYKINFIRASKTLFPTYDFYSWIDFGFLRDMKHLPKHINTTVLPKKIIYDCIKKPGVRIDANEMLSSNDIYMAGGCYIIHSSLVEKLEDLWDKKIAEWQANYISDDDQSLVLQLYFDNPDLFFLTHSGQWFSLYGEIKAILALAPPN